MSISPGCSRTPRLSFPALGLAAVASVYAADAPKPACALVKACGLSVELPSCGAEQSRPLDGVVYDAARCSEPRDLLSHGVTPDVGMGPFVYPFLGGRYRLVYDIGGEAPISEEKFDYLAQDLPFAAKLASRFSKTKYVIQYADAARTRFHAARGDQLTGDAELLFLDAEPRRRTYYGWGSSKFGPWKLRGSAYVDVRIHKAAPPAKGIVYDVRIRTAPTNAMVNAIMRMGLFKGMVTGQIEDTMKDLIGAAATLSTQGIDAILKDPAFSADDREKVRALSALP
jgi:hypothetical protein